MLFGYILSALAAASAAQALPALTVASTADGAANHTISPKLFMELEELARIVDISYCVGTTGLGIQKPFSCLNRCSDFESFELVQTFNTGPLLSDSCGYIALSHPPARPRVIVAFRGTYSIANTIADLSTVPQEYVPYPGDDDDNNDGDGGDGSAFKHPFRGLRRSTVDDDVPPADPPKCDNCSVHTGFYTSWLNTRRVILPALTEALEKYPDYELTLVGHSLGGAVAALASLDLMARGWEPHVTTFGEPRIGNPALNRYLDARFGLLSNDTIIRNSSYRRVTHVNDPVPLLPLEEWDYHMHGGEVFISKESLPPTPEDILHCVGDEDGNCIAGSDNVDPDSASMTITEDTLRHFQKLLSDHPILPRNDATLNDEWAEDTLSDSKWDTSRFKFWPVPTRYKLWQLFFAHRDYFWRLGLCVPGGDPRDWYRKYPHYDDGDERLEL